MDVVELSELVGALRANIVQLEERIAELEAQRMEPQVEPRPPGAFIHQAQRMAAIRRLAAREPTRRSFTSLEVMEEMAAAA